MSTADDWVQIILSGASPQETWKAILGKLKDIAIQSQSPEELYRQAVPADRLLAEGAWELWRDFQTTAPRTALALCDWWSRSSTSGRAVLILDALSLREMGVLISAAAARGIIPVRVDVTAAEIPSDTDQFARALGAASRAGLAGNKPPSGFSLSRPIFTDVLKIPFEDCLGSVPYDPNVVLWHTWLDDLVHLYDKSPEQIFKLAAAAFRDDSFWKFVDRMRQGRRLVITADHGYAVSKLFATEDATDVVEALRETFGASRYQTASDVWAHRFMPPLVATINGYHVVIGPRKWKVQGGFPHVCHGGMSLFEVAVPFIELPPL